MKYSKTEVHCKTHGLPALRFEDSQLTSFSGLVLLQALFARLGVKERLRRCFSHLTVSAIFGHATLVLCLVLHLTLGYRRLRDIHYYSDDPWSCGRSGSPVCPMSPRCLGDWRVPTQRVQSACRDSCGRGS